LSIKLPTFTKFAAFMICSSTPLLISYNRVFLSYSMSYWDRDRSFNSFLRGFRRSEMC